MLKIEQYSMNMEHLLTLPGEQVNHGTVGLESFEIRQNGDLRWIRFPDGTIQSVMLLKEPALPVLTYIQALLCSLLFMPRPSNLLNLGLGSGSIERFILSQYSDIELVSVEIDARIIEISKQYFHIPSNHTVFQLPAEKYLEINQANFDILVSDICTRQGTANSQLSADFVMHAARALNAGGVFAVNILPRSESEIIEVLIALRCAFPWILLYDVADMDNIVLFCTVTPSPSPASLMQQAKTLYQSTGLNLSPICRQMIALPAKK
ncbi:MAG: methyltransferase [Candidatus Thiodiazotropha taylori]|nr:methyltransferase [Candidatus Thiodiazotropha taylori]MCW4224639.1 methyltransferase [Candidatus Thiodiazotropha endolucinida]MCG7951725.1 methyltransferase [Candidatus Thiodiazotropha taylori]MCG8031404.1 methyltransferase [Candidatus Thiodiazotropha taylori]MCG8075546.1 methyltransferase [Candidatus Thiodiazotropha taylori]